ncbi:MAG: tetrahydromethanopterin S-methyltransferase subunit A [Nitrosopumilaceae archaeon]
MKTLENAIGKLCKAILPINEEMFFGNQKSSIAICTLSSISLLKEISESALMEKIVLAGRLLSENKGIDSLVRYVITNNTIKTIIMCGKDVTGHKAGHSLLTLCRNGIDDDGRIIGSQSPDPVLTITKNEVTKFCNKAKILDMIGETNLEKINQAVDSIS